MYGGCTCEQGSLLNNETLRSHIFVRLKNELKGFGNFAILYAWQRNIVKEKHVIKKLIVANGNIHCLSNNKACRVFFYIIDSYSSF